MYKLSLLFISPLFFQTKLPAQSNIFPSSGKTDIGTLNPESLLTINTGNTGDGISLISGNSTGGLADIFLSTATATNIVTGLAYKWAISLRNDGYFSDSTPNTGLSTEFYALKEGGGYYAPLCFSSFGNLILVSNKQATSGNVLIGKTTQTNASYKLDVNGNIRANKMVVNTTGADYVFGSAFSLLPLSDVETYIIKNRHLPGIPSAVKMQSEGLNLGVNQMKLLQKIEELTLYTINQGKELSMLRQQLEEEQRIICRLAAGLQMLERVDSLPNVSNITSPSSKEN